MRIEETSTRNKNFGRLKGIGKTTAAEQGEVTPHIKFCGHVGEAHTQPFQKVASQSSIHPDRATEILSHKTLVFRDSCLYQEACGNAKAAVISISRLANHRLKLGMEDEFVRHNSSAVCDDFVWHKIPPGQTGIADGRNGGFGTCR